jgi:hypothetical protein
LQVFLVNKFFGDLEMMKVSKKKILLLCIPAKTTKFNKLTKELILTYFGANLKQITSSQNYEMSDFYLQKNHLFEIGALAAHVRTSQDEQAERKWFGVTKKFLASKICLHYLQNN